MKPISPVLPELKEENEDASRPTSPSHARAISLINDLTAESSEENVRVVCRFRPINAKETHEEKSQKLTDYPIQYPQSNDKSSGTVIVPREAHKNNLSFTLDKILQPSTTQDEAFRVLAQPLVEQVLQGYNCTIFAYGQTGSGKTFTMFGPENNYSKLDELGIIPRSVDYLFELLNNSKDIINFRVSVAVVEVYKEILRDLLDKNYDANDNGNSSGNGNNSKSKKRKAAKAKFKPARLEVFTSGKETVIRNLSETQCHSVADVLKCIIKAQNNRKVRTTEFIGHHSSRSHCVVMITVMQRVKTTFHVIFVLFCFVWFFLWWIDSCFVL